MSINNQKLIVELFNSQNRDFDILFPKDCQYSHSRPKKSLDALNTINNCLSLESEYWGFAAKVSFIRSKNLSTIESKYKPSGKWKAMPTLEEHWCHWANCFLESVKTGDIETLLIPPITDPDLAMITIVDRKDKSVVYKASAREFTQSLFAAANYNGSGNNTKSVIKKKSFILNTMLCLSLLDDDIKGMKVVNGALSIETIRGVYQQNQEIVDIIIKDKASYKEEQNHKSPEDKKYYLIDSVMTHFMDHADNIEISIKDPHWIKWFKYKTTQSSDFTRQVLLSVASSDMSSQEKALVAKNLLSSLDDDIQKDFVRRSWLQSDFNSILDRKLWKSWLATTKGLGISKDTIAHSHNRMICAKIISQPEDVSLWLPIFYNIPKDDIDRLKKSVLLNFITSYLLPPRNGSKYSNRPKSWELMQKNNIAPDGLTLDYCKQQVENSLLPHDFKALSSSLRSYSYNDEHTKMLKDIESTIIVTIDRHIISQNMQDILDQKTLHDQSSANLLVRKRKM